MNKLIKTPNEHAAALHRLSALMDENPPSGTAGGDEIELLAHLIEVYESTRHAIGLPDPMNAIEFRMEQQGLSRQALVPLIGSMSRVSEVLSGKRGLSLAMIRRLHAQLHIPTDILVQPSTGRKGGHRPISPALKG